MIHYIFSSDSLHFLNSLQIVNSLRVLFLVLGIIFATPTPTYKANIWTNIWPPNCQICLVLKHLGSYFVQMFVHIFALYVGGGGHQRISETVCRGSLGIFRRTFSTRTVLNAPSCCRPMLKGPTTLASLKRAFRHTLVTNPGTTPITILPVNSDHGLSFAREETRTMVWVSFSLQMYSAFEFWRFKFFVVWVLVWVSSFYGDGGGSRTVKLVRV